MNIEKERELFEEANPWASEHKFVGSEPDEYGNFNMYLDDVTQIKFAGFRQGLEAWQARAAKVAEWISVKDRLPAVNEMVACKNKAKVLTTHRHREERNKGGNFAIFYNESKFNAGGLMTHWMPLDAMLNKEDE